MSVSLSVSVGWEGWLRPKKLIDTGRSGMFRATALHQSGAHLSTHCVAVLILSVTEVRARLGVPTEVWLGATEERKSQLLHQKGLKIAKTLQHGQQNKRRYVAVTEHP
jgi:hypothetical protein